MWDYLCSVTCYGKTRLPKSSATDDSDDSSTDYCEFLRMSNDQTQQEHSTPIRESFGIQRSPFAAAIQSSAMNNYNMDNVSFSDDASSEVFIPAPPSPMRGANVTPADARDSASSSYNHHQMMMNYAFSKGDFSQINEALQSGRWDRDASSSGKATDEQVQLLLKNDDIDENCCCSVVSDISMQSAARDNSNGVLNMNNNDNTLPHSMSSLSAIQRSVYVASQNNARGGPFASASQFDVNVEEPSLSSPPESLSSSLLLDANNSAVQIKMAYADL